MPCMIPACAAPTSGDYFYAYCPEHERSAEVLLQEYAANPERPDWLVLRISERRAGSYPFHVSGVNLNSAPGEYGHHFSWSVPSLTDTRYAPHPDASPEVRAALAAAKVAP